MRVLRIGAATVLCDFRKNPVRLLLLAALLGLAASGAGFLLENAHAQAVAPANSLPASSSASSSAEAAPLAPQPAATAGANSPDRQLGELFQMATELKTEVGKTNQEMLSIAVVRKAAAIEQLAHKVRIAGGQK